MAKFNFTPNIVELTSNYVIYEYIEGNCLNDLINQCNIKNNKKLIIASQIIEAMISLNKLEIIHKDIKPENIIISENKVYIIDFGASRIYDGTKNRDTVLLGTKQYASPEHYGYQETSFKSDMYSVGQVLKDLKLPESFTNIYQKCLNINPEDRYESFEILYKTFNDQANDFLNTKEIIQKSDVKKIDIFKKGFCFDKNKKMFVFSIVIALFFIYSFFEEYIKNPLFKSKPFENFAAYVIGYLIIIYLVDLVRISIMKINNFKVNYWIYLLNNFLGFWFLSIMTSIVLLLLESINNTLIN